MTYVLAGVASIWLSVSAPPQDARPAVMAIVEKIRRADYEGDRVTLQRLHGDLDAFVDDRELGPRVLYWRGFAMWRRALNGFNDAADPTELEESLTQCVTDFRAALAREPGFVDAKIGAASCLVNDSFLNLKRDPDRARALFTESTTALNEAKAAAPDNPRLLWVEGANQWFASPEHGGGQAAALATYEKGLDLARRQKRATSGSLQPSWGEAELLMNLALANIRRTPPDVAAAERYADEALALVPNWHYVRDILVPQIRKAKGSQAPPR